MRSTNQSSCSPVWLSMLTVPGAGTAGWVAAEHRASSIPPQDGRSLTDIFGCILERELVRMPGSRDAECCCTHPGQVSVMREGRKSVSLCLLR